MNQLCLQLLDYETKKYMKPYLINLINAIVLIILGSWAYLTSGTPSITALIPVLAGVILTASTPGFKRGNRVLAHIAVTITLIILLGLLKPLIGAISREDNLGITRVLIMITTSLTAMVIYIKSFIDARRNIKE